MLPIEQLRDSFFQSTSQIRLIQAPPGAGKTVGVPAWLLAAEQSFILVEPRRVAARAAWDYHRRQHACIGLSVRFQTHWPQDCRAAVVTPGILLNWLQTGLAFEPEWILLDEVHERSLQMDMLIALLQVRTKARLVFMSATPDSERLIRKPDVQILNVSLRQYPLEIEYSEDVAFPSLRNLHERVFQALRRVRFHAAIVFLPGKGEIRSLLEFLKPRFENVFEVHGGLELSEQQRVLHSSESRILLSTNLLESAVTAEGVDLVVDSGLVRNLRFFQGREVLLMEPVSQASATQRAGRAGRQGPGRAIRLWRSSSRLEAHGRAEIETRDLSDCFLRLEAMGVELEDLNWPTPPPTESLEYARHRLQICKGVNTDIQLDTQLPIEVEWHRLLQESHGLEPDAQSYLVFLMALAHAGLKRFQFSFCKERQNRSFRPDLELLDFACRQRRLGDESAWFEAVYSDFAERVGVKTRISINTAQRDEVVLFCMQTIPQWIFHPRQNSRWHSDAGEDLEMELPWEPQEMAAAWVFSRFALQNQRSQTRIMGSNPLLLPRNLHSRLPVTRRETVGLTESGRLHHRVFCGPWNLGLEETALYGSELRQAIWAWGLLHQRNDFYEWFEYEKIATQLNSNQVQETSWERFERLGVEHIEDLELIEARDLFDPALAVLLPQLKKKYPLEISEPGGKYTVEYNFLKREIVLHQNSRPQRPSALLLGKLPSLKIVWECRGRKEVVREGRR